MLANRHHVSLHVRHLCAVGLGACVKQLPHRNGSWVSLAAVLVCQHIDRTARGSSAGTKSGVVRAILGPAHRDTARLETRTRHGSGISYSSSVKRTPKKGKQRCHAQMPCALVRMGPPSASCQLPASGTRQAARSSWPEYRLVAVFCAEAPRR